MENIITWSDLLARAPEDISVVRDCDPICERFRAWAALGAEQHQLVYLGRLVYDDLQPIDNMEVFPSSNYWSPDDPIALGYYPYNVADVYQMRGCDSYYFVYTEFGGHVPERRARLIQKNLILMEDLESEFQSLG